MFFFWSIYIYCFVVFGFEGMLVWIVGLKSFLNIGSVYRMYKLL